MRHGAGGSHVSNAEVLNSYPINLLPNLSAKGWSYINDSYAAHMIMLRSWQCRRSSSADIQLIRVVLIISNVQH